MLTASEIQRRLGSGLTIEPFNIDQLGPNSYDVTLDWPMKRLIAREIDIRDPASIQYQDFEISQHGTVLYPGTLYLGSTVEIAGSSELITCLEGRSSLARIGVSVHETAGFGDLGFVNHWTLEISVRVPTRLYRGTKIAQLYFFEPVGDITRLYTGKYEPRQRGPVESKITTDPRARSSLVDGQHPTRQ